MYLYKATCSEIPNLKPKGIQRVSGDRAQTRISRENSVDKAYPYMCWSGLRTNTHLELKHLDEFLNTHAISLQDSVPTVTGMVYRYTALCALVYYLLHSTVSGKRFLEYMRKLILLTGFSLESSLIWKHLLGIWGFLGGPN